MDDKQLDWKRRILHHYRQATKSHLAANVGNFGRKGTAAVPTLRAMAVLGGMSIFRDYLTIQSS